MVTATMSPNENDVYNNFKNEESLPALAKFVVLKTETLCYINFTTCMMKLEALEVYKVIGFTETI